MIINCIFTEGNLNIDSTILPQGNNFFTNAVTNINNSNNNNIPNTSASNTNLIINRDFNIFKTIVKLLQGYTPNHVLFNSIHSVQDWLLLLDDLSFYQFDELKRAVENDLNYVFIDIGGTFFKFNKSLVNSTTDTDDDLNNEVFNWGETLFVPDRSSENFAILLNLLRDSSADITNKINHITYNQRESLIQDCEFFKMNKLKQLLISCKIFVNPFNDFNTDILINVTDIDPDMLILDPGSNVLENDCTLNCNKLSSDNDTSDTDKERDKDYSNPKKKRKININDNWDMIKYIKHTPTHTAESHSSHELNFQFNDNESLLVFNKQSKIIHIDIMGKDLLNFEKVFQSFLLNKGIQLSKFKFRFAIQPNGIEKNHLILPACISIADLNINGMSCRNVGKLISESKCTEKIIDFTNMSALQYSCGLTLNLQKSVWKIGLKGDKLMLIAIKLDTVNNIKDFNKSLEFL